MIRVCPNCGKKSLTSIPGPQPRGQVYCRSCKTAFPWGVMFPETSQVASPTQATLVPNTGEQATLE